MLKSLTSLHLLVSTNSYLQRRMTLQFSMQMKEEFKKLQYKTLAANRLNSFCIAHLTKQTMTEHVASTASATVSLSHDKAGLMQASLSRDHH